MILEMTRSGIKEKCRMCRAYLHDKWSTTLSLKWGTSRTASTGPGYDELESRLEQIDAVDKAND